MHAIQTLAHRAPPATRTRARWQPYSSIPTPSRPLLLNTPISVSPSPFPVTPSNDALRPTPSIVLAQTPKDTVPKEPIKAKGSFSAVDQAVKALCEIWHPQDIPKAFLPPRGLVTKNEESKSVLCHTHQAFTSSRQPSTLQHLPPLPLCADSTSTASSTSHDPACHNPVAIANHLAPMKTFVHEVLRRSRTSGCVLQTALCYLEAIRAKVPQLLQEERAGIRPDTSIPRIIAVEELTDDMASESDSSSVTVDVSPSVNEAIVNTVRIVDQSAEAFSNSEPSLATAINADVNGASLPSPLLCPRRAFLASLILASKFTQDKCYSNRAWAKLSGLPPKEISRCERALGEALDWRLWVGKQSAPAVSAGQRTLSRSQSESCLVIPPSPPLPSEVSKPVSQTTQSGLRRCATLPAEAYASQMPRPLAEIPVPHYVDSLYGSQDHVMAGLDVPAKAMHSSGCSKNSDSCASSPSPSTPSLAYSPSSSESSGGDQTVQMSTYFDEPVQTPAGKTWPWPDRSSELVLLNGAGLPDLCSKTALDLSSLLVPGGIAANVNLDAAWYSSEHSISPFSMPTLHTVECS